MATVEEAKAELRAAVEARDTSQWRIGDAALQLAPMGEPGVRTGGEALLEQFVAAEIEPVYGVSYASIRVYRTVAHAWPADTRVAAAWAVHRELMAPYSRQLIRPGMTVADAVRAKHDAAVEEGYAPVSLLSLSEWVDDPADPTQAEVSAVPRRIPMWDTRFQIQRMSLRLPALGSVLEELEQWRDMGLPLDDETALAWCEELDSIVKRATRIRETLSAGLPV